MTNHENNTVAPQDGSTALVGVTPPSIASTTAAHAAGFGHQPAPSGTDVLKGGMDRSGLFHALRRRWLLATCMGLLIGATTAALLYWTFPESYSATVQYKADASPLNLLERGSAGGNQTKDFSIFKKTQLAYIRSPFVLTAAFRNNPEINDLSIFDDVKELEKVQWLQDQLEVSFPNNGELLQITLAGPYPKEELKQVVEAVSKAYWEDVIVRDRGARALPLQILRRSLDKLDKRVREKMEDYQQLAKDSGTSEAYQGSFDPETRLMLTAVQQLQSRQAKVEAALVEATMQYSIFERQIKDPAYQEQMVEQALQGDPMIAQMQQEMMYIQMQIRSLQSTVKNGSSPAIRRLETQYQQVSAEINQMKEQMRAQIAGQNSGEPNPLLKSESTSFQVIRQTYLAELNRIGQQLEKYKQELLLKAESNTDLMLRSSEIEQLRDVAQGIAMKIQNLQVENEAPNRITAIGSSDTGYAIADTFEDRNKLTRLFISAFGGLTALGLTCLGIGYMEFRNRKLNGPEQVDEGLGIRVVGTLPSLSGRKALNPRNPVVAQLNESIDSVRTALMHESTTKQRRLVLVTSAETGEGRTTVASQLAASLARAGRRTLLIDGDLRRPALHTLFNAPLEDGLCEVLRTEAEVTDVIRPTQAEGLWLMTAGYCDADAVQALATDQAQPIFEKLRADYDFIIIDGAPVLGLSDSLLFGQHCDGAVLSVLRDYTCVTRVQQAAELLRGVGVKLIGSVVNGVPIKADRRVTHLQQVTPKSEQKQLETAEA